MREACRDEGYNHTVEVAEQLVSDATADSANASVRRRRGTVEHHPRPKVYAHRRFWLLRPPPGYALGPGKKVFWSDPP